jgi:hypothetical protein
LYFDSGRDRAVIDPSRMSPHVARDSTWWALLSSERREHENPNGGSTAGKHNQGAMDVLRQLFAGNPWLPAAAASA